VLLNIDTYRDGWNQWIPSSAGLVRPGSGGKKQWKFLVGQTLLEATYDY